jgi:hypothetical protein
MGFLEVKENEMGLAYRTHAQKRIVNRILVGKPEGKSLYADLVVGGTITLK